MLHERPSSLYNYLQSHSVPALASLLHHYLYLLEQVYQLFIPLGHGPWQWLYIRCLSLGLLLYHQHMPYALPSLSAYSPEAGFCGLGCLHLGCLLLC